MNFSLFITALAHGEILGDIQERVALLNISK